MQASVHSDASLHKKKKTNIDKTSTHKNNPIMENSTENNFIYYLNST